MTFYASTWQAYEHPVHAGLIVWYPVAIGGPGFTGGDWAVIDLRRDPDANPSQGRGIVWTLNPLPLPLPTGVAKIADTPDSPITSTVRTWLNNNLGTSLPAGLTLRQLMRRLMTLEARGRLNDRWEPIVPNALGQWEIFLGDLGDTWTE